LRRVADEQPGHGGGAVVAVQPAQLDVPHDFAAVVVEGREDEPRGLRPLGLHEVPFELSLVEREGELGARPLHEKLRAGAVDPADEPGEIGARERSQGDGHARILQLRRRARTSWKCGPRSSFKNRPAPAQGSPNDASGRGADPVI